MKIYSALQRKKKRYKLGVLIYLFQLIGGKKKKRNILIEQ